jgi:cysteine desulfuration protein SufE
MSDDEHSSANKVQGCVSQVWLARDIDRSNRQSPILNFRGDSDAHIVRGLIAILLSLYSGRSAQDILSADALKVFNELGFADHLTPQRSNGLRAMVERIRADARETLAEVS